MKKSSHARQRGFSLVELSIVLVVVGLLIGGVIEGQSLVRGAQTKSVISDFRKYTQAFTGFRDKYNALPGDMANATSYWGSVAGNSTDNYTTSCSTTATTSGTATCNGNGDNQIYSVSGSYYEIFRAWQQLANAGLIEGQYTGVSSTSSPTYTHVAGSNCPKSRIAETGEWEIIYYGGGNGTWYFNGVGAGHRLAVGGQTASQQPITPVMTPTEAWNIDLKLDDGKPGLGTVTGPAASSGLACATTSDPTTAAYNLSSDSPSCILYFYPGF